MPVMKDSTFTAPDFELLDGRGDLVRLSGYRGQQVVLFFTRSFL
jgi:peroxiredoxin